MKKSLHLGLNEYGGLPNASLQGCVNDTYTLAKRRCLLRYKSVLSLLLIVLVVFGCAQVEVSTLVASKVSWQSLEAWNAHLMGKLATKAKAGAMTEEDWDDLRWHRNFSDKLMVWKSSHETWLALAGKEQLTPEEEQRLIDTYGQLTEAIVQLVEEAEAKGYKGGEL